MKAATKSHLRALIAGMLVANSAPHLASAAAGNEHLTPVAGKHSSPGVNLIWGTANLLGGLALLRVGRFSVGRSGARRWDTALIAFGVGAAGFATWMAGSEAVWRVNTAGK